VKECWLEWDRVPEHVSDAHEHTTIMITKAVGLLHSHGAAISYESPSYLASYESLTNYE
jgi:hypothetical protein